MEYKHREVKEIGGMRIPALGIGTWGIGGKFEKDESNRAEEAALLSEAIALGYAHIDTAEIYGNTLTEEIVGEAIRGVKRESLFITTKAWHTHLSAENLRKALLKSLRRLSTDYVDLYLIHWPGKSMDMKETMQAMEALQEQGLTRHIGVSNFSVKQVKEAQSELNNTKIAAVQSEYSLLMQDKELLRHCTEEDMALIAYRPLARGVLSKPGIGIVDALAKKYEKTRAQLVLNWLITKGNVTAIPKASSKDHMAENLGALGWRMQAEDCRKLDDYR